MSLVSALSLNFSKTPMRREGNLVDVLLISSPVMPKPLSLTVMVFFLIEASLNGQIAQFTIELCPCCWACATFAWHQPHCSPTRARKSRDRSRGTSWWWGKIFSVWMEMVPFSATSAIVIVLWFIREKNPCGVRIFKYCSKLERDRLAEKYNAVAWIFLNLVFPIPSMRLLIGLFLLLAFTANAQKIVRNQTYTSYELLNELNCFEGQSLVFENCVFTHSMQDNIILWGLDDYTDDSSNGHKDWPRKLIDYSLEFKNSTFSEGTNMQK